MDLQDIRDLPNGAKLLKKIGSAKLFKKNRRELIERLDETTLLGEGSCRSTWDFSPTKVLKIPNSEEDSGWGWSHQHTCASNIFEYLMYKRAGKKFPLAPCSLRFYKNIPLILMEKVDVVSEVTDDPEWIEDNPNSPLCQLNDGFQIGLTRKGKMVCFDYGYEGEIFSELVPSEKRDLSNSELKLFRKFPQIVELKGINQDLKEKLIKALEKGK